MTGANPNPPIPTLPRRERRTPIDTASRYENTTVYFYDVRGGAMLHCYVSVVVPQMGTEVSVRDQSWRIVRIRHKVESNQYHVFLGPVSPEF